MAEERLEEIRAQRISKRAQMIADGQLPYPSEVRRTHTIAQTIEQFDALIQSEETVMLLGRVNSVRSHGAIAFLDIADESSKIQLQATKELLGERFEQIIAVDSGDFIEATGTATLSRRGEKTILITNILMASKAIRPVPNTWFGLKDIEVRSRQRELDLLANPETKEVARKRSKILHFIRTYLTEKDFIEVETPILQPIPGGTLAEPFTTHHNALDADLYLRIAPELYLKRLLVGGFEKVFEIGKNFRNEGVDKSHNPEFTMLEFYWAYADYEDLMDMAEELLSGAAHAITGSFDVPWGDSTISFKGPFARYSYTELIKERTGIDVMQEKDPAVYKAAFKKHGITPPEADTYGKLVDELYKEVVRPTLHNPTILYDYPIELVPLAKKKASNPNIAEMFQLVIAGMELVKAYTELNDPIEQRERFEQQQAERDGGNKEAHVIDENYLRAMEYGMPPAAGFGLGIDRLAMLLTNTPHLRDTILFPLLKTEE
ncbi:MAG: lysine--tRNA ligase [Candidatus Andersenbacteria bacterium RIFCSPHIGHO2_02_FULL_45_11]|uniref:Lysine--tRNA ligase n=1 Tax=Candidatus Andersenbacteria bacterium RIFCSPHIGHO2_12_FULL_45_11 TaxID=1797281 RepID=A0A1G1X4H3_9BACT|nr:MAG: lysine--tRNA ligase [Candidatus Andersenbacteria bacterium RIFCSPHIGHO2_01_FULL_46_36]OGY34525.1 MAG: lysine--tRNA ligase [Candidatus Andersenbacteria bacterium RIFCSPHIGHO2_02_FULL_45_11]OGY34899.1 MAG: lysine--tRNA ligase [Candidatus Andersenbacteria bacterium RIFCSPHIGHO2_12_FULL_45_11]